MKAIIQNLLLLPALLVSLGLMPSGRVTAQTFTNLYSFTGGGDGGEPYAGLTLSGNTLYGTALFGGFFGGGTVFAINTDGSGFTNLYNFTNSSDGDNPSAGLILSGSTLYGTASQGGSAAAGAVFAVNTAGSGFTNLYSFNIPTSITNYYNFYTNSDGANPQGGLTLSGSTLYGTASDGGTSGNGTVFAVNADGTDFTNLHNFTAGSGSYTYVTNSDGANPGGSLILSGNTLFGTTPDGGTNGNGTVFAINTDGSGFTNLYVFTVSGTNDSGFYTNGDGANPQAGLVLSGGTLFGTAASGGYSGNGTVFAINTDGSGFTNLHDFTASNTNASGSYTNGDGINPQAGLILSGNTLFGTTAYGGGGFGTVFAIGTDGTGFVTLHSFTSGDGANPQAGLILSGNTLFGTTANGGGGYGTVFSLSLMPSLGIAAAGGQVTLSWPLWASDFGLQSATNLVSPAVWNTVSPAPSVVNGQNVVTNPVSSTQMFYRLSQ